MIFRSKFRHHRSIHRLPFAYRVRNFVDFATFSIDFFCILYAESPPYFYFRFVLPTDLESRLQASTTTAIISATFDAVALAFATDCRELACCEMSVFYVVGATSSKDFV